MTGKQDADGGLWRVFFKGQNRGKRSLPQATAQRGSVLPGLLRAGGFTPAPAPVQQNVQYGPRFTLDKPGQLDKVPLS